jgi:phage portal protein BeeE
MGIRDNIQRIGLNALGAIGATMADVAGNSLAKATTNESSGSDSVLGGSDEDTAASNPVPTEKATEDPKALMWDPYSIVEQLGYKDRPSSITYGTLKAITYKMPIVQAIINTRVNQVAAFATPQKNRYQLGYRVKLRDHKKNPTKAERDWMNQMESVIMRTGVTDNPRGRDGFETFLRKIMNDSLIYDQYAIEIVPNRKGVPAEWYAVDAATIRLADNASANFDEDDTEAIKYVQIYDGMIIAEYTQEEMFFGIRNPRTDIRLQGYGVSELEMLIVTITNLLYSFAYNQNFFTQGSGAKGILNFKGVVPEKQLQNFRKQWYTQVASVENAWRMPITNSDDLQYISMQTSNRDMEFNAWMDFQIKLAAAMYLMDPVEMNFQYGNVGQKTTLGESNNKEKITESKERGLRPLLRTVEKAMNQSIIWPINEAFEFEFVGLDAYTRNDMIDVNMKRVKSTMTIDELRAEDDLEPLPDGKGQIILDPTWLQNAQGVDMGGEEGEGLPGEEGSGEEGGDKDEDNTDYEKLLAQYEAEEDEEESERENESDSERKKRIEKSQPRSWTVTL